MEGSVFPFEIRHMCGTRLELDFTVLFNHSNDGGCTRHPSWDNRDWDSRLASLRPEPRYTCALCGAPIVHWGLPLVPSAIAGGQTVVTAWYGMDGQDNCEHRGTPHPHRPVPTFKAADVGCYLDSHHGWHNTYRVVDLAAEHGFYLSAQDQEALQRYRTDDPSADWADFVLNQGGLSDEAIEFLNSITEGPLYWDWSDGDLLLTTPTPDPEDDE